MDGKATVENGACLCRSCHDWLEQLSELEREKVNDELREYKENFILGIAEITTEGIKQTTAITEAELFEQEETITIPVFDYTEQEYQEFLQEKRKKELEKPRWKNWRGGNDR